MAHTEEKKIKLDEKDRKILEILRVNSKYSTKQISKKTAIPITTVHNRLKNLEKNGVIKRYTIELNKKALGLGITAFILITIDGDALKDKSFTPHHLTTELIKREEIEEANTLAGHSDLIVKVSVKDIEALNSFIIDYLRKIEGIGRTETLIVLDEAE